MYSMKTCSQYLFVFCGILASFLDWISLSVTVVIPRPESSLSVNMQLGRKILGAKIEIVNCLLVFCTRKWRFHLFSESSCCTATEVALAWVINGSTSGSESLYTARLFRLFLAFTALGQHTRATHANHITPRYRPITLTSFDCSFTLIYKEISLPGIPLFGQCHNLQSTSRVLKKYY